MDTQWTRNDARFVRSESHHIGLVAGVRAKVHQGPMYCSGRGPRLAYEAFMYVLLCAQRCQPPDASLSTRIEHESPGHV